MVTLLYVLIDCMPSSGKGIVIINLAGCIDDVDELIYRAHPSRIRLDRGGKHAY